MTDSMTVHWYSPGALGSLAVALLAGLTSLTLGVGCARGNRCLIAVAVIALVGQVFHASEDVIQALYWLTHPFAPAYMTPGRWP